MARMLGAARLSHSTDGSTSVERQGEQITATATARGDTLIHITTDVDVSGKVPPRERADLGPWLTDPAKIDQWDVLCVAKLDRLTRSLGDFDELRKWCDTHGKTLVSVSESLDLSTSVGRMFANLLAMFAQFERERIGERRADHTRKAVSQARWDGRRVPWVYQPVKVADHWELEPHPVNAQIARDMAASVISGQSARSVARDLASRNVPCPQGGKTWDSATVIKLLRNPVLRGHVPYHGDVARGEDGLPVTRTPVLDDLTWTRLQTALDRRSAERRTTADASLLRGVATCWDCGEPVFIQRRSQGNRYRHNDRSQCESRSTYLATDIERAVQGALLFMCADVQRAEMVTEGADHSAEIARAEESLARLDDLMADGTMTLETGARMAARLEAQIARLRALPAPHKVPRFLGETFGEHWARLDTAGRNAFLRDHGVKVRASRRASGPVRESIGTLVRTGRMVIDVQLGDLYALTEAARTAA